MLFQQIVENALDSICVLDENNKVIYANNAFCKLTDFPKEDVIGKDFSIFLPPEIAPSHAEYIKNYLKSHPGVSKVLGQVRKLSLKTRSDEIIAIELKAFELPAIEGKIYFAGIIRDLRERLLVSYEHNRLLYGLNDIGYLDEVSHLPNQKYLLKRLENYLDSDFKEGVFALIDIDGLDIVNRQYGREIGDELIKKIGHDIQSDLRVKDTLARWEGSSLAVVLPMTGLSEAIHVLDKLRFDIANTKGYLLEDPEYVPSVSVGCSRIVPPRKPIDTHIYEANKALFKAKIEGKNKLFIFGFY
ncbi:MAG: diguanylate cyclase [Leptospiraceae bacterium]|nr:diguanylate cyclase [Leptospiraceae bacterium]